MHLYGQKIFTMGHLIIMNNFASKLPLIRLKIVSYCGVSNSKLFYTFKCIKDLDFATKLNHT